MIQRKRQRRKDAASSLTDEEEEEVEPDASSAALKRSTPPATATTTLLAKALFSWRTVLLCVVGCASFLVASRRVVVSKLVAIQCITLLPVGVCLYAGLVRRRQLGQPWYRSILPLTLVATVVCSQLPLCLAAAIAAAAVTSFALATLPTRQQSEDADAVQQKSSNNNISQSSIQQQRDKSRPSPTTVVMATILLVTVLLTENFMIWVVSATFHDGQTPATAPPPLQDNGQRLLAFIAQDLSRRQVVGLRRLWNVQWSLVACMGASFVVTDLFLPHRHLYCLGTRAILALAAARCCRTVSFCLTVLPSQSKHCYQDRQYPYPPPLDWMEWIWVGLLPASHGGCNDLIISGHATVTSTLACIATSVAEDAWFAAALWTMVALDYAVEIYEGFHYSVDMWLGMVVVSLFWRVLHSWEGEAAYSTFYPTSDQNDGNSSDDMQHMTRPLLREAVLYSIPAILAYLQLVVFPKWTSNFLIVGYVIYGASIVARVAYERKETLTAKQVSDQHFGQHVILCLLYMALGIYL